MSDIVYIDKVTFDWDRAKKLKDVTWDRTFLTVSQFVFSFTVSKVCLISIKARNRSDLI